MDKDFISIRINAECKICLYVYEHGYLNSRFIEHHLNTYIKRVGLFDMNCMH